MRLALSLRFWFAVLCPSASAALLAAKASMVCSTRTLNLDSKALVKTWLCT